MWPFTRKQKKMLEAPSMTVLMGDRGLNDLSTNTAELRIWLPETGRTAYDEIINGISITGAKYIREFFVVYLYGMHELLWMQRTERGLYYKPPPKPPNEDTTSVPIDNNVKYSRSPSVECIPGLGKNIIPFKVFIPPRIKADLQGLADRVNIPLSQFAREVLISHFLGHTFWPEKLKTWSDDEQRIADEWEQGIIESEDFVYHGQTPTEIDGKIVVRTLYF